MTESKLVRKYAFEGAICNGKTTLLEHYQQTYSADSRYAFVTEAGREFITLNPDIDYQVGGISEGIQSLALSKEKNAHDSGAATIFCDRSVLSAVVYERAHGFQTESERLLKRVEPWLPTYTSFFILDPSDIPYAYDDVRKGDAHQRQMYQETFIKVFDELGMPYEVISGSIEDRVKKINSVIG